MVFAGYSGLIRNSQRQHADARTHDITSNTKELFMNCANRLGCKMAASALVAASMLLSAAGLACAQDASAAANLSGADRDKVLLDNAKKEGMLTIYSSLPQPDNKALADGFTKKYGIKVTIWRGSSEKITQRAVTENRAGRYEADMALASASGIEPLYREKLLQEVKSPVLAELLPQAVLEHRPYASLFFNVLAQTYNTNQINKDELPKTYKDLTNPKWKGKVGIEAEDYDWFAEAVKSIGEQEGLKVFRDIVTTYVISVRSGHTLLTNLVAAGEVPLALTVYNYSADQAKHNGAPVDWFFIGNPIARPVGLGVMNKAPHPYAAVLFFDFALGKEGQEILAKRDFTTANKTVASSMDRSKLKVIDNAVMLDQADKWQKLYDDVIKSKSK
jgi:iron(III) transport system substrate-binding protein